MKTYSVVVESGSSSTDYQRWEERAHCGHRHKTLEAAEKCRTKLTRWYCNHGRIQGMACTRCLGGQAHGNSTSAKWYNARIHNQDQERVESLDGWRDITGTPEDPWYETEKDETK